MRPENTEVIELASEGFFYPSGSILASGVVEMLPLTAVDEDVLGNVSLAKRGLVLPRILKRVLPSVEDIDCLLQCDVETVLLNTRILNYGPSGELSTACNKCDREHVTNVSFTFQAKPFNFNGLRRGYNVLQYEFPTNGKLIYFRLPTWREHIEHRVSGWLSLMKKLTLTIEDEPDINDFFDLKLSGSDSRAFRGYFENNTPGFTPRWNIQCPDCGDVELRKVDIDTGIFNVRPETKHVIHSEIFNLCYHMGGAFTYSEVYNMPVSMRSFYIKKLVESREDENNRVKQRQEEVKSLSNVGPQTPASLSKKAT